MRLKERHFTLFKPLATAISRNLSHPIAGFKSEYSFFKPIIGCFIRNLIICPTSASASNKFVSATYFDW
jgi:hypothetical protein